MNVIQSMYKNGMLVFQTSRDAKQHDIFQTEGTGVASPVPSLDGNLFSVTVLAADKKLENTNKDV
jgi:hypothetical protein